MRAGWRTYRGDVVRSGLKWTAISYSLIAGSILLIAVPLYDTTNALEAVMWALIVWGGLLWFGGMMAALVTEPMVYRRTDVSRQELVPVLQRMLELDSVRWKSLSILSSHEVAVRMREAPYVHLALNMGSENLYVGTVLGRTEVALGPYQGEHARVIDKLMREIDMTLDNL